MRKISILGSTGSIGTQTLEIVRARKRSIQVTALAARSNIELLEQQIREFRPRLAAVWDEKRAAELAHRVADTKTEVLAGREGILAVSAAEEADTLVTGIVGMIGIEPTIAAIRAGKNIALANKETLVCAGHIIMPLAKSCGVKILPVDSEHSAIFQCLRGNSGNRIEKILLTASGGPFRRLSEEQLKKVTLEAHWLFDVDIDRIQVVIQPQSIIHSAVEYADGAVIAQLGTADMKLPIQYALFYPRRLPVTGGSRLDFAALCGIELAAPDMKKFPGLALAFHAGRTGGSLPTVFNAANEVAVAAFLKKKISYPDIAKLIHSAMEEHEKAGVLPQPTVSDILAIQADTERQLTQRFAL